MKKEWKRYKGKERNKIKNKKWKKKEERKEENNESLEKVNVFCFAYFFPCFNLWKPGINQGTWHIVKHLCYWIK